MIFKMFGAVIVWLGLVALALTAGAAGRPSCVRSSRPPIFPSSSPTSHSVHKPAGSGSPGPHKPTGSSSPSAYKVTKTPSPSQAVACG